MINDNVTYRHIECSKMSDDDIQNVSTLFSQNYGFWSDSTPTENIRGKQINFTPAMIKNNFVNKQDRYIIMAYINNELAGYIVYLKRKPHKANYIVFVLQLVVAKKYRNQKIATRMMNSIWHQSNCFAWGLFTSNPKTIKVLEEATMRKVNLKLVEKNIEKIKEVAYDAFKTTKWIDNYENGIVSTDFFVDHKNLQERINSVYPNSDFMFPTNLPEGKEWLAITFRSQSPFFSSEEEWDKYLEYSQNDIVTAYSNMRMERHSWAKHTSDEVDFLANNYVSQEDYILDFGCGIGRHTAEFKRRGYDVFGIDFSEKHIEFAKKHTGSFNYTCADIRNYRSNKKADVAICLYDVVGSFPNEKDNLRVLRSINKSLKHNGKVVLSVMNMELTQKRCKHVVEDITNNIDLLLSLPSSNTMQESGDVFEGTKMIIERKTGIVYRKEQFSPEDSLPCELIVRDKRYTISGIQNLMRKAGFNIDETIFFQAGRMDKPLNSTNNKAKEILVVGHKASFFHRMILKFSPLKTNPYEE